MEQILLRTEGKGVDRVIIAGGDVDTFDQAVRMLKPGGVIGNVNYLGEATISASRASNGGVGMGHKKINGGLTPGGRRKMEKMAALLQTGKLDTSLLVTHRFQGMDKNPERR